MPNRYSALSSPFASFFASAVLPYPRSPDTFSDGITWYPSDPTTSYSQACPFRFGFVLS